MQNKFFLTIVLVIVPVLGVIFSWVGLRSDHNAKAQIVNQARILARQIILTRQWVADCGGVMVPRGSEGARKMIYFLDDRLKTSRGILNRFTPAMVTKKLSQYSLRENMYHFRLASLNPMNPGNNPDAFERMALLQFIHNNTKEVYHIEKIDGKPTFRYTVPLYVDKACLDCHQNFTRGSIGGCLSFFLPIKQALKSLKGTFTNLAFAGIAIILLTGMTLFFLLQKVVIRPVNKIKTMTTEISNGNHQARTHLETGDEFEELGRVFNHMAEQLERNHEIVQEKIETATQELCQANCELKQLDKFKTDFITDMSHELRSPVTAIQGSLDYLKRTTTTNDNKSYLAIIDNNLMRMTHLITDMLDLARIESGKIAWRFEESDMAALIQEVVEILGLKAQERNITLDYDHQGPVWVEMDPERIEQVLVNLMENAIKFSPSGSTILINSSLSDQWIRVVVQDFATGIAEKNLETIFKKFRILPSSGGTGRTKGTGLGLTICRKIIEAHKGRIWAESTVGLGSTFYFILPARPADKA